MQYLANYLTCPLFHMKQMRTFRDIASQLELHETEHQKGEWILEKGMASKEVLVVLTGSVEELAGEARERVLQRNDCFALSLAITQNRSMLSYRALEQCVIGHVPLLRLKEHEELMENVLTLMARETEESAFRLALLSQKSTREKVAWFLEEQSRIHHSRTFIVPMQRKEIASLLGITPTALYLELRRLEEQGLLKIGRTTWRWLS